MKFKKGKCPNPKGRGKGTPNKVTSDVKANIEAVFEGIGGVLRFQSWANQNPDAFFGSIYAKLLPKNVSIDNKGKFIIVCSPVEKPNQNPEK